MGKYNFEEITLPTNKIKDLEPRYSFYSSYNINLDRPKPNYDSRNRNLRLRESVRSK